jgi:hypothetical protein
MYCNLLYAFLIGCIKFLRSSSFGRFFVWSVMGKVTKSEFIMEENIFFIEDEIFCTIGNWIIFIE